MATTSVALETVQQTIARALARFPEERARIVTVEKRGTATAQRATPLLRSLKVFKMGDRSRKSHWLWRTSVAVMSKINGNGTAALPLGATSRLSLSAPFCLGRRTRHCPRALIC